MAVLEARPGWMSGMGQRTNPLSREGGAVAVEPVRLTVTT
jgi:hypothetical protein